MTAPNINADLFGEPAAVTPTAPKKRPTTRRVYDAAVADAFYGFEVTGYSPQMLEAARHAREDKGQRWDEDAYMRTAKPAKVSLRPYQLLQAARTCAEMATDEGWKGVKVEQLLRRAT
jgi:hypothetical protein